MRRSRRYGKWNSKEGRPGRWATSALRRALRRPIVWWALVALAAITTGVSVQQQYARAVEQQLAWGSQARVVVATADIDVGESIASATELRVWPSAVVPDGALTDISVDDVARVRLVTGELILAERVSSGATGGLVDLLPAGTVAVGVPIGSGTPPLSVGDRVDLLATFNRRTDQPTDEPDTTKVAERAVVVDVTSDVVTVAIDSDRAAATASALSRAAVTIALTG